MSLCLTCDEISDIRATNVRKASWVIKKTKGKGIPLLNDLKPSHKNKYSKYATLSVTSYVSKCTLNGRKNTQSRKVLFWASLPVSGISQPLKNAPTAYGTFRNHGITTVQKDGKIVFNIESPQPYVENKKPFPAHVHFVMASSESKFKDWDRNNMYVLAAFPGEHKDRLGNYVLVERIPTILPILPEQRSILLPAEVKAMQDKFQRQKKQLIFINAATPKTEEVLQKEAKRIGMRPYIVFGPKSKASAASRILRVMVTSRALRAYYTPHGIRDLERAEVSISRPRTKNMRVCKSN